MGDGPVGDGPVTPPPGYRDGLADAWQMLMGVGQAAQRIGAAQRMAAAQPMPGRLAARGRTMPLTVISGFLGAGKTTLLNRLLMAPHGRRLAVLVNDFGALNIDSALIERRDGDVVSLANGCACCSLASGLTNVLIELARAPSPPDAVVLEASGIAEPRGIAHVALANPAVRLDGILTLVDAVGIEAQLADPHLLPTVERQITAADLLVLNKLDLVPPGRLAGLRARLAAIAPASRLIETTQADVPIDIVLGLEHVGQDHVGGNADRAVEPARADMFQSWSFTSGALLDPVKLLALIERLPAGVLRAKGILWLADRPDRRTVLQMVGRRWSLTADRPWLEATPRSDLVVIAKAGAVAAQDLGGGLEDCRA